MKLNLGCGKDSRPGFVNVDRFPAPGVDVVMNLDWDTWPWADASVDFILASASLEHVLDFGRVWSEIRRILKPGGTIEILVPYGPDYNPFHARSFTMISVRQLCMEDDNFHGTLEQSNREWSLVGKPVYYPRGGFPWWHLWKYAGLVPRRIAMRFVLRKS